MPKISPLMRLIKSRRSVRRFKDKSVPRELLLSCVEAARLAPSACNAQPWRFLIVDEPQRREYLAKQAFSGVYLPMRWAGKAPVLVALLARLDLKANRLGTQVQGTNYYLLDIGIAGEHFVLRAHELGLGSCWLGWFSAEKARKALGIPKKYRVVELIAVGYPADRLAKPKKRRSLKDIVFFNKLG